MLGFSSRANWRNCCTARCWSIWYRLFIATLSFSWQKKPPSAHYDRGCESRYFLRINGHPPGSVQTAYNSTDTNALSAGADSPGERGACSFFLGIATAQHPLSSLLHLFIAGIARSLSRQVLVV